MSIQTMVSPSWDELVVMSRRKYQDLLNARDHAAAMRAVAAGADTLTDAELGEYFAAPMPLAYWRKRRGVMRAQIAAILAVSQACMTQLEAGKRTGNIALYARLADALGLRIEDLVPQPTTTP